MRADMIERRFSTGWYLLFGLAAFALLQLHYALAWTSYYARYPIRGYDGAIEKGLIPPSLMGSTRSMLVGWIVLVLLPLVALWFRVGRRRTAVVAMWAGVMIALVGIWIGTPRLRQDSNMWPIDLVFLLFMTGLPLLIGAVLQFLLEAAIHRGHKRPPTPVLS